jgi:hypothetical protein
MSTELQNKDICKVFNLLFHFIKLLLFILLVLIQIFKIWCANIPKPYTSTKFESKFQKMKIYFLQTW